MGRTPPTPLREPNTLAAMIGRDASRSPDRWVRPMVFQSTKKVFPKNDQSKNSKIEKEFCGPRIRDLDPGLAQYRFGLGFWWCR